MHTFILFHLFITSSTNRRHFSFHFAPSKWSLVCAHTKLHQISISPLLWRRRSECLPARLLSAPPTPPPASPPLHWALYALTQFSWELRETSSQHPAAGIVFSAFSHSNCAIKIYINFNIRLINMAASKIVKAAEQRGRKRERQRERER